MNLLDSRAGRRVLFTALYASEGAPMGYIWWALPVKLTVAGLTPGQAAAFTAPLVLPWSLKFLWAPLIDTLQSPAWGLRAWIVASQTAMGLLLLPAFWLSIGQHSHILWWLLIAHAVVAATQDVSVDALCVRATPRGEQGAINGWMQVGMLTSRAVFGGAILYFERAVLMEGWGMAPVVAERAVFALLLACIWGSMLLVIFCTKSGPVAARRGSALGDFLRTLAAALFQPVTLVAIAFAIVGGAAWEATAQVIRPLLVEQGVSQKVVGQFTVLTAAAMAAGALAGGWAADRVGRIRFVTMMSVLVAVNVVAIAAVLTREPAAPAALATFAIALYVLIGAFTASSYGLFMNLTDPRLGGTQFSTFMAATNVCEYWAVYALGRWTAVGPGQPPAGPRVYAEAFVGLAALSMLALPLLWFLSRRGNPAAQQSGDACSYIAAEQCVDN